MKLFKNNVSSSYKMYFYNIKITRLLMAISEMHNSYHDFTFISEIFRNTVFPENVAILAIEHIFILLHCCVYIPLCLQHISMLPIIFSCYHRYQNGSRKRTLMDGHEQKYWAPWSTLCSSLPCASLSLWKLSR